MTYREMMWILTRAGTRREAWLVEHGDGEVECAVMNGLQCVHSHRQPSRDSARVLGEHLRQAHLADGWRDEM